MAASWPDLEELKQTLDVSSNDWDGILQTRLDAAVEQVKNDVGDWDDVSDSPTHSLSSAALLLATRIAKAPAEAPIPADAALDPAYQRLLKGHRRRFPIG